MALLNDADPRIHNQEIQFTSDSLQLKCPMKMIIRKHIKLILILYFLDIAEILVLKSRNLTRGFSFTLIGQKSYRKQISVKDLY